MESIVQPDQPTLKGMDIFYFFDEIHCINLEERKDRLNSVYREFKKLPTTKGIIRCNAIKNEIGWIGARDSHIAIIREAKNKRLKNVLVFEDDVLILEEDKKYYHALIEDLKFCPDFHLFYFSANTHSRLKKHTDYLFIAQNCLSTHSICYNSSIFDKILSDYDNGLIKIIDTYLMDNIQTLNKSYIANKLCMTQKNDFSSIENKIVDYSFIAKRFEKNARLNR